VRELEKAGDRVTLEMKAGIIPAAAAGDVWTLEANAPKHRAPAASRDELASMLGLAPADMGGTPLWVDTGADQLVIPLATFAAVRRASPRADLLQRHASNGTRSMAYAFAREQDRVLARFFFLKHGGIVEDPGTGSACANLGGWLLATNARLPQRLTIDQGQAVGRACRLGLEVTARRTILVSGRVIEIARGALAF
jgi:PhzF family phenazine biosynthesis protein